MNTSASRAAHSRQIAIVGAGAIGTAFGFQLAGAGHAVTLVARGARLAQLRADGGIVTADGRRADVEVVDALDVDAAYDLVIVSVLYPQVDAVLPALSASRARRVMFMFNTFEPIARLAAAVGDTRATFGFPMGVFCLLKAGRIAHVVRGGTTVVDAADAALFSAAGIPTTTTPDMHAWLRTHAALVFALMSLGVEAHNSGRGASMARARTAAVATRAAFALVRALGHPILPSGLGVVAGLPQVLLTLLFFAISRTRLNRDLGALGPHEPRMLIDQMAAASTSTSTRAALLALRP